MSNPAKLQKTPIVDRNGVKSTRMKRPAVTAKAATPVDPSLVKSVAPLAPAVKTGQSAERRAAERIALRFAGNKWADGDFQTHREALVWVASLNEEGEERKEGEEGGEWADWILALVDSMPLRPPGPPPRWTPTAPRGGRSRIAPTVAGQRDTTAE